MSEIIISKGIYPAHGFANEMQLVINVAAISCLGLWHLTKMA